MFQRQKKEHERTHSLKSTSNPTSNARKNSQAPPKRSNSVSSATKRPPKNLDPKPATPSVKTPIRQRPVSHIGNITPPPKNINTPIATDTELKVINEENESADLSPTLHVPPSFARNVSPSRSALRHGPYSSPSRNSSHRVSFSESSENSNDVESFTFERKQLMKKNLKPEKKLKTVKKWVPTKNGLVEIEVPVTDTNFSSPLQGSRRHVRKQTSLSSVRTSSIRSSNSLGTPSKPPIVRKENNFAKPKSGSKFKTPQQSAKFAGNGHLSLNSAPKTLLKDASSHNGHVQQKENNDRKKFFTKHEIPPISHEVSSECSLQISSPATSCDIQPTTKSNKDQYAVPEYDVGPSESPFITPLQSPTHDSRDSVNVESGASEHIEEPRKENQDIDSEGSTQVEFPNEVTKISVSFPVSNIDEKENDVENVKTTEDSEIKDNDLNQVSLISTLRQLQASPSIFSSRPVPISKLNDPIILENNSLDKHDSSNESLELLNNRDHTPARSLLLVRTPSSNYTEDLNSPVRKGYKKGTKALGRSPSNKRLSFTPETKPESIISQKPISYGHAAALNAARPNHSVHGKPPITRPPQQFERKSSFERQSVSTNKRDSSFRVSLRNQQDIAPPQQYRFAANRAGDSSSIRSPQSTRRQPTHNHSIESDDYSRFANFKSRFADSDDEDGVIPIKPISKAHKQSPHPNNFMSSRFVKTSPKFQRHTLHLDSPDDYSRYNSMGKQSLSPQPIAETPKRGPILLNNPRDTHHNRTTNSTFDNYNEQKFSPTEKKKKNKNKKFSFRGLFKSKHDK